MNVAVIKTDLFPDTSTMERGIEHFYASCNVYNYDATRANLKDEDWDQMLDEVLSAERIIVI